MSNLFDYIDWRGDLTVNEAPFCEVDNLIMTQFSFVDFSGIVQGTRRRESITLRDAADMYFARQDGTPPKMGVLVPDSVPDLLRRAAESRRFCNMRLVCYESMIDKRTETQFAALSVLIGDGTFYVSFRGTDDTLVGWKEDLNMSCMEFVPSQEYARQYLEYVAKRLRGHIHVGGHSKGGNLAIYAAANASRRVKNRILQVYNNDGPGFSKSMDTHEGFAQVKKRITTIVPRFSVVGLLLEHGDVNKVVESHGSGIWQHDPFTWEVRGNQFVQADSLSPESLQLEKTLKGLIAELDRSKRRDLVEALYKAFTVNNAETLTDIAADKFDFIKSLGKLDAKTRDIIFSTGKMLLREGMRVARDERALAKEKNEKDAKRRSGGAKK